MAGCVCVSLCERQCDSPCVRVQGWVCTRVAPVCVCVCAALSPHCREEGVGAAAEALLWPGAGAGHLAGAVGGSG